MSVGQRRRLYLSPEAAERLGLTAAGVRWRLRNRKLRGRRIRSRWRVLASELRDVDAPRPPQADG